jgi:hypothetical protein
MKTGLVLGAVLLSIAGGADAHWIHVMTSEASDVYIDLKTIRRDGGKVKAWNLEDFDRVQVSPAGRPYISSLTQSEYDCESKTQRKISDISYSGKMGRGEIAATSAGHGEWQASVPATIPGVLHVVACRER